MFNLDYIFAIADYLLFASCLLILGGSLLLTYKTNFIQIRAFKTIKYLFIKNTDDVVGSGTVSPIKALFTAMSTTLGISSIVAPVIAIHMGGPGALLGFLFTAFFGGAATYKEVELSLTYRKEIPGGGFIGGPMQYLEKFVSKRVASFYAICCLLLMTAWSGGQANQLAAILDSPLLGDYRIPVYITGAVFATLVVVILLGGIQRIASFSAKLVPSMFVLYLVSCLWIIGMNIERLPWVFSEVFDSMLHPRSLATGAVVGGALQSLRWGIFKGMQVSEAGIGTQSFPHSAAATSNKERQATLAILSTYMAGFVALLSGCITILTGSWQDPTLPLGISMVAASFFSYFSHMGTLIVTLIVLLFSFGTSLGNSYNGGQCFSYLAGAKKVRFYILGTGLFLFIGAVADVKAFWSLMDIILAATALPHIITLTLSSFSKKEKELIS